MSISALLGLFSLLVPQLFSHQFLVFFFLLPLFLELPLYLVMLVNVFYHVLTQTFNRFSKNTHKKHPQFPLISCIVAAYNEGASIKKLLLSLYEQLYPGPIEIFIVSDNPMPNDPTRRAIMDFVAEHPNTSQRRIMFVGKTQRGGHASSCNLGLKMAKGEYVFMLDGDTSCDNDVLSVLSEHFSDKNLVGLSGTLRVANIHTNILTRLQGIEYALGIGLSRLGLSTLNVLNIISGAFGVFNRQFILQIGGWKNGSAEDLDLVIRIKAYFKKHPNLGLLHDSRAIAHTDAPTTWRSLLKQRFRWEGDLFFIYCRRHWRTLRPKYLGWVSFISIVWHGLLLQIAIPLTLLCYCAYFIFSGQLPLLFMLLTMGYIYYFLMIIILFLCYLLLVSERKAADARLVPLLVLMPIYQFILRLWAGVALLFEMFFKTHLDTTMAPYTITRQADKE